VLSLEQVRKLEARVSAALGYIDRLSTENAELRQRLSGYEGRIKDLEVLVRDFQQDQSRIEEGILHALKKLDAFEESVQESGAAKQPKKPSSSKAEKAEAVEPLARLADAEASTEIVEAEEIIDEGVLEPLEGGEKGEGGNEPESGELDIF
jgi:hypothetical protein